MMRLFYNSLVWIFLFALILRIFQLDIYPTGFHVDEVKVGWNSLSIIQTGMDDHKNSLSLHYNTFGDYRPTGIFYFSTLPLILFGSSEFAVRFSSALFGALTVFPIYLIVYQLTKKRNVSLLAAFFVSISPWHLSTSRATSEVVISTFFALFGIYFIIKLAKEYQKKYILFSFISFLLSYSLYHSIRVLAPLFIIAIGLYFFPYVKLFKKGKLVVFTFLLITGTSFIFGISNDSKERLKQVSFLKDIDLQYEIERINTNSQNKNISNLIFDNKPVIYFRKFVDEYLKYFSTGFLTGNLAKPYRYISPGVGLLTYFEFAVLILGVVAIIKKKYSPLPLILLLISPLSAALTIEDSPNLHRAFLMLPFILIIEGYGLSYLFSQNNKLGKFISILIIANFIFFLHVYINHSTNHKPYIKNWVLDSASYRSMGAKDLALKIELERNNYEKIIVTNFPDNLYPWYSFFTNKSPRDFNGSILSNTNEVIYKNIIFSDTKCPSDFAFQKYNESRILVVDSWECPSETKIKDGLQAKIVGDIKRTDGSTVYNLLERK